MSSKQMKAGLAPHETGPRLGKTRPSASDLRITAVTSDDQDVVALRVVRLHRLGVPRGLAGTLAMLVFGEGRA